LEKFLASHDVVFFEWASELLALASRLPRRARVVTRLHRYEMYQWADQVNWGAVDAVILVSEAKRKEFRQRFPGYSAGIHVIPEAVNTDKFPFRPKPFSGKFGTLCHLSPRKRVYELILAFYEVARQNDGLHLYIGGGHQKHNTDYDFALHDLVDRLGLRDCVTFDGPVSDTAAWYEKIDVFISNSFSEGLQVAPIEAMASGCYCLSHWWAGADELLPEENLYLTDSELQRRMTEYIQLPQLRKLQRIGALRATVEEKFNAERTAADIRAVIEGN
jgi:glycosyltransferase involved in cell wall biosynthesis